MSVHSPRTSSSHKHFTPFYSAAEEAQAKAEHESWDNEGGHMSSTSGRLVRAPDTALPYKVVLSHDRCAVTAHAFATMREAEAFIRRNMPVPAAALSKLYDREAD